MLMIVASHPRGVKPSLRTVRYPRCRSALHFHNNVAFIGLVPLGLVAQMGSIPNSPRCASMC